MLREAMAILGMMAALLAGGRAAASGLSFDFKDPKEISAVSLTLDSQLEPIVGYAKGLSGTVHFDPANPKATTGKIAVDVASVQFANEGYTATARGYALRGDKYPQIFFTLRKVLNVTRPSANVYRALVQADFTCKGITLPLTLPVTASYYPGLAEERTNGKYRGDVLVLRTGFSVSRKKLGISEGIPDSMVGDAVQVGVAVVGLRYAPEQTKPEPLKTPAAPNSKSVSRLEERANAAWMGAKRLWEGKHCARPYEDSIASEDKIEDTTGQAQKPPASARAQINQPVDLNLSLPEIGAEQKTATLNLAEKQAGNNLVLFFFSEQCGVTFRYKQRLQQLQKEFDGKGFIFVGARCGKREKPDEPLDLAETRYLKMAFVDDASGVLMDRFRVRQSLTFAVIDKTGRLRYRGGFDNNVDSTQVTKSYLRSALRALAAGKPVGVKEGFALGCAILPIK